MKLRLIALFCATLFGTTTPAAFAQLAAPNNAGVAMGHIHLNVHDVDAARQFYVSLGGRAVRNGTLDMVEFPGAYIILRKQDPTAGTVGSVVDHFGFLVPSMEGGLAKWKSLGYKIEAGNRPAAQNYVISPDGVKIEMIEDKTISVPIKFHHVHYFVPDPLAAQAWYAKEFGAVPGKRAQFDAADIPGANLTFSKADMPLAGTKGRAVDHVGFEVANLAAFAKKLEADGIKFDRAPTIASNGSTHIAFIYDPWDTYIELTEGLAPSAEH
jgi:catechol 2,3-dioxygenase-like lactoylglutathione lyase family enzyme